MKVNILQVDQARFLTRLSWWSLWVDVALYDYNSTPFLLQMKVSRFNRKRFKSIRMTGTIMYRQSTASTIGDLTPMESPDNKEGER